MGVMKDPRCSAHACASKKCKGDIWSQGVERLLTRDTASDVRNVKALFNNWVRTKEEGCDHYPFGSRNHASWEGVSGLCFLCHYFLWKLYGPSSQDWHLGIKIIIEKMSSWTFSRSLPGSEFFPRATVFLHGPSIRKLMYLNRTDWANILWKLCPGEKEHMCTLKTCVWVEQQKLLPWVSLVWLVFFLVCLTFWKKYPVANVRFPRVPQQTFRSNLTLKAATPNNVWLPSCESQLPSIQI